MGDELLKSVAQAISASIRPADVAARLSGDEFVVLVDDGRDIGAVIRIAERIIAGVARPRELDGRYIAIGASVGIAASRDRAQGAENLLHEADVAMYAAKTRGKGRFAVFDPSLESELNDREQLRGDLANVVSREELILRYQPIRDLRTGALAGVEALHSLGAPDPRGARTDRVHPACRRIGGHRAHRTVGPPPGVPAGAHVAGDGLGADLGQRQHLGAPAPAGRLRGGRLRDPGHDRTAARVPDPGVRRGAT